MTLSSTIKREKLKNVKKEWICDGNVCFLFLFILYLLKYWIVYIKNNKKYIRYFILIYLFMLSKIATKNESQ